MTIKQLKALLDDYPDNLDVFLDYDGDLSDYENYDPAMSYLKISSKEVDKDRSRIVIYVANEEDLL